MFIVQWEKGDLRKPVHVRDGSRCALSGNLVVSLPRTAGWVCGALPASLFTPVPHGEEETSSGAHLALCKWRVFWIKCKTEVKMVLCCFLPFRVWIEIHHSSCDSWHACPYFFSVKSFVFIILTWICLWIITCTFCWQKRKRPFSFSSFLLLLKF